ncbi:MAG: cysteine synthase family protein [Phycisphaerales bacterium]|nr:cysteine synthase family protein [Phycisphaerales bacterium]
MTLRFSTLHHSITDLIGKTPLLELHNIARLHNLRGRLLAKLEYLNPGLSKKDRIALQMVKYAKENRLLHNGQTVVELTSGNTGTGLAIVCKAMGHPFVAVMSRGNTIERARMMQALGAEVILVDQAPGSTPGQVSGQDLDLVELRARQLVAERHAFRADQFEMQANALAHERTTAPELWEQSAHTIDVFLDFAGTAGSFTGIAKFLKQVNPKIRCYLVEPASAAVLAGKPITDGNHKIQGGGYSRKNLTLLDPTLVTGYLQVSNDEAIHGARMLAAEEGVFAGFSSGAHLAAAMALLQSHEPGATIAFLACDSGLKYLSTDLFPMTSI